ncbi:MAG: type transport system permease protein [Chloroflexota bacterium]|jgi:ABC-2 type transport system permease protein|nr:type transport system permease protein [Chloroflexota bacterium]
MTELRLLVRQIRYENRAFWRNPAAAFFTFAFPLIFMFVFNAIFGGQAMGSGQSAAAFFTPAIVCFSIVNACYTNLAMSVSLARDEGILKRIMGTPLPAWIYLMARIGQSVLIGLVLVAIVSAFGAIAYGVPVPWGRLPELVLVLAIGSACFCALGLAVSGLIPNARAAPAVVNATILPLLFISDVFIPLQDDNTLARIGSVFPVRHLAEALQSIWTPDFSGALDPIHLLWLLGWAIAGLALAMRTFSWDPRV